MQKCTNYIIDKYNRDNTTNIYSARTRFISIITIASYINKLYNCVVGKPYLHIKLIGGIKHGR